MFFCRLAKKYNIIFAREYITIVKQRLCIIHIYIPPKSPFGLASLTLPPSRLGIAQVSLALLSTCRRLKKGDLVATLRVHQTIGFPG